MIDEKLYQSIYEELDKYLSFGWSKLLVYLEYGEDSYTFSFYVKIKEKYVKCYDIPNVSIDELMNSFQKIDLFVSKERNKVKEKWTNMTLMVDNTGNMHTDFDYTDLSEVTYEFRNNWKKKYLI